MPPKYAPLGIRRVVERGNRPPLIRIEELVCPCCGHLTRVEWEQESMRVEGETFTQTHCERKGCAGYKMTSDVPTFFERYGQNKLQSKE